MFSWKNFHWWASQLDAKECPCKPRRAGMQGVAPRLAERLSTRFKPEPVNQWNGSCLDEGQDYFFSRSFVEIYPKSKPERSHTMLLFRHSHNGMESLSVFSEEVWNPASGLTPPEHHCAAPVQSPTGELRSETALSKAWRSRGSPGQAGSAIYREAGWCAVLWATLPGSPLSPSRETSPALTHLKRLYGLDNRLKWVFPPLWATCWRYYPRWAFQMFAFGPCP